MQINPFTALNQAISQLITSNSPTLQATGLDIFRGLAVILIAWFGIRSALSAAQGHGGGFHFAKFADLILMISFGLGMLTYYSTNVTAKDKWRKVEIKVEPTSLQARTITGYYP